MHVGVSVGPPPFAHLIDGYVDHAPEADYSHQRAERLGARLEVRVPFRQGRNRQCRQRAGAAAAADCARVTDRLWYGGGSQNPHAGLERQGFNLLTGNIVSGENTDDFLTAQAALITRFRQEWAHEREPRVGLGRVILPTDSASAATRRRYADFVASRTQRTKSAHGPRALSSCLISWGRGMRSWGNAFARPGTASYSEFRLELPYEFQAEDYGQIIEDFAGLFPVSHKTQRSCARWALNDQPLASFMRHETPCHPKRFTSWDRF